MKKHYFNSFVIALSMLTLFSSCENNLNNGDDNQETEDLVGEITEDLTLESGLTYTLSGGVHVKAGATLTIEPGVTIIAKDDSTVDYLLIEQNAKIDAQGTATMPIVMTSENKTHGAWGGLHICGNATINVTGDAVSEIGDASYGGSDDADNSGTLKYIRIEYAGYAFSYEKEANGFTFYGVGNGTKVEYLQAYKGSDDGFEWFGGTVNCNYLISTDNTDDAFDWTQGWRGTGSYWIAEQESADCDALIEADNNSSNTDLTPISKPILSNLTLIGNNSTDNTKGIRLRAGTYAEINNAVVIGKVYGVYTETTSTENSLVNGSSSLENIALATTIHCNEDIYSQDKFLESGTNLENAAIVLDGYACSVAGSSITGALSTSASDWTQGWSLSLDDDANESNVLIGSIASDVTLKSGSEYYVSGGVHVKEGATLTIEPGVKIIAIDDAIVDYILIEQGAKIEAEGTASSPIIMTSEKEEHGAWGGLHICGKATINVSGGTSTSEIGDATYGGSDDSDNSGTLKYIRIEYAGYAFSYEKEANGFTFYGVGDGTTVDYLQAYKGSDDGFEWFGGTVNCKHLVATDNTDDSFDWTQGYRGKLQFLVAEQESSECDALIEADNSSSNYSLSPISHPVLVNVTLVGNNSSDNKKGVRLRAGTEVEIYNALVTGKANSLVTETEETENSLVSGTSILNYVLLENGVSSNEGIYSESLFLNSAGNEVNSSFALSGVVGSVASGLNVTGFDEAPYAGAIENASGDWTENWTLAL